MRKMIIVLLVMGFVMVNMVGSLFFYKKADAAPKILNISHQWAKGDIRDLWVEKWAELVTKKTEGAIELRIFPGQSLFKTKAQHDAMRKGALDASVLPLIYLSGRIPAYALTSMPCLIKTAQQGANWGDHEIGKRLYEIGVNEGGFRTVSSITLLGSVGSVKQPIILPSDMKGLKMRGAGPATEEMMHAGEAAITSMPGSEVYFALQTGALDALMTTYESFVTYRHYEVLKNLTVSKTHSIFSAIHGILVSNKTWDKLAAPEQRAMTEAGREVEPHFTKLSEDIVENTIKIYRDKGLEVYSIGEKEFNAWLDLTKSTSFKTFAEKVKNGEELLNLALEVK